MRKLIISLMVVIMCGTVSANLLVNSSFEESFIDEYSQIVTNTTAGSFAYGGKGWQNNMPSWNADENWGFAYCVNGTSSGGPFAADHTVPTAASDGNIIYGAGHETHFFGIWQNIFDESGIVADGTKNYVLTYDFYHDSTAPFNVPWLEAKIQMGGTIPLIEVVVGGVGTDPGVANNTWVPMTMSLPANMDFDGAHPQIVLRANGGSWIDNVSLTAIPEPAILGFLGLLGLAFFRKK